MVQQWPQDGEAFPWEVAGKVYNVADKGFMDCPHSLTLFTAWNNLNGEGTSLEELPILWLMLCSIWRQSDYREQCCIMVQNSDTPASISNKKMRWLISICGHSFNKNGSTWEMDRVKEIGENALSTPLYFLWEGKILSHIGSYFFSRSAHS